MSRSATAISVALVVAWLAGAARAQRPSQGEDESAAFVREGRAALRRGDLDDAARALDQALALNPRRVEAYVLRSAVYAARKQYRDGIALMRRAQQIAPRDTEVLTALGTHLVLAGDTSAGVPLLEQVVAKEPARYDAQLLLGQHWHATGKWSDAIRAYEAYFAHRPQALAREDARNQIELADSYLRFHQPAKALALFRAAAKGSEHDLRARMGIAWATAAIDCRKARPLLHELEPIAEQHPEVWLVDGRCALALGDATTALALARRYLEHAGKGAAAGHALVAEVYAARGQLPQARRELETARELEPARRRWAVRLAFVLRRAKLLDDALATLEEVGKPASAALDPDWWIELGEVLLAKGEADEAAARLAPIVPELAHDAPVRVVLGAAQLAAGKAEAAVHTLEEAEAIRSTPRSRAQLAEALAAVAVQKLAAGDAAAAEPLLARAEQLHGSPVILRDLGIAKLALGKPAEAIAVLDRAVNADADPIVAMLDARAHALAGDMLRARELYERALAADKDNVEIAIDWAASELAGGDPAIAVGVLEKTQGAARIEPLAARHRRALATARHAAGLAALRAGNGETAVELLRAASAAEPSLARTCDLAVASVAAGDRKAARSALDAIRGQRCPFPPPADTQAAPILVALAEGLAPGRAGKALDKLTALAGKTTGPASRLLGAALRIVALDAARDAYRRGKLARAHTYVERARKANAGVGGDEIAHDLAVLELAAGRVDAAIRALERLAPRVPEAYVNLGIAYEREGEHGKALEAWRRARKAGVRFAPLADWIDAKQRVHSEEAP